MSSPDNVLLDAFLDGEPAAVAEVSEWIRLSLLPFRGRLGDEVDDLHQEALTELVVALRRLTEGPGSLRGFAFRLAQRSAIDRLRARRRWRFEGLADAAEPVARDLSALEQLLRDETRGRLLALLGELPALCRELFRQLFAGASYREMAASQGVSEGALRVRVLRCRRRAVALARGGNDLAAASPGPTGEEAG